jgi:DNA-binding beta-propeller fold protein YncE
MVLRVLQRRRARGSRAAILLSVLLASACAAPTAPAPAASLAPIVLAERALRPLPAFGSIWVASAAEGTVQRIDPANGAVVATITVADPKRLLAAGCAPSSEHAYATGSFGLRACDAPSAIAAGAGAIWAVANDAGAIVRVDPARNVVADTFAVGFAAWSLAATADALWLTDYANDAVVRVDPRTGRIVARIAVPSWPTELAVSGGSVWVVCSAAGTVVRIDGTQNAVTATIRVGPWALAIAIAGDDVWVRGGAARTDGGLYRIDARTNAVALVVQAGAPEGREGVSSIAATDRGVWIPGVSLDFVDRSTGGVAATLPIPSYAVALEGETLWILDVFGRLIPRSVVR